MILSYGNIDVQRHKFINERVWRRRDRSTSAYMLRARTGVKIINGKSMKRLIRIERKERSG